MRNADQANHLSEIAPHKERPSPQASFRRATKPALIIGVKRYARAGECGSRPIVEAATALRQPLAR